MPCGKRVTRVGKNEIFNVVMNETTGWTEFFTDGNVGPDRVSRRASHFCHTTTKVTELKKVSRNKKTKKQTNQCHGRPAWASCWSGRTMSHNSGSTSNKPQFSQRV